MLRERIEERKKKMDECCELCEKRARMQCDSDQAKLCWDCDEKVHSANFLVAKHSRILLCSLCQSPTPWKASGPKLTPTASYCHHCVANRPMRSQQVLDDDHRDYEDYSSDANSDNVYDDDDADAGDDDDDDGEEEEEEGENQVVPWSSVSASPQPPPRSTNPDADGDISSDSGGASAGLALKRLRDNSFSGDSDTQDEMGCASSEMRSAALPNDESTTSTSCFRPLKQHVINQRNH